MYSRYSSCEMQQVSERESSIKMTSSFPSYQLELIMGVEIEDDQKNFFIDRKMSVFFLT